MLPNMPSDVHRSSPVDLRGEAMGFLNRRVPWFVEHAEYAFEVRPSDAEDVDWLGWDAWVTLSPRR